MVFSPSGTRACFGSDWENHGYVDAYVVEPPVYDFSANGIRHEFSASYVNYHFSVSEFSGTTLLQYSLPCNEQVKIEVYNSKGSQLQVLDHSVKSAGNYSINYKPRTSGVCYYRLAAGDKQVVRKTVTFR